MPESLDIAGWTIFLFLRFATTTATTTITMATTTMMPAIMAGFVRKPVGEVFAVACVHQWLDEAELYVETSD
jgi:hypothetical protein